jgi:hypothetical protein
MLFFALLAFFRGKNLAQNVRLSKRSRDVAQHGSNRREGARNSFRFTSQAVLINEK